MKIKCEFCGSMINDTEQQCPNCGAPNPNVRRSSGDQPLTIEQLKQAGCLGDMPETSQVTLFDF